MRRLAALLLLVLPACGTPCPTDPLTPLTDVAFVVRFNEAPVVTPPMMTPGLETFYDPPGVGTYAAFALYGDLGVANERWLDSATTLEGVAGTVDAASALPSRLSPGTVTLLLADGLRPAVGFATATGEPALSLSTYAAPPDAAGQLVDLAPMGDGTALATRRRSAGGAGGDLLLVDAVGDRGVLETFSLAGLAAGAIEPGAVAPLYDASGLATRALVSLALPDEDDAGAVAVVDVETGDVRRFDVPGLTACGDVVALPADATGVARAAVLCTGDLTAAPAERRGVGLALLEAAPDLPVALAAGRPSSSLFSGRLPTESLVGLAGAWVAVVAGGDVTTGRPDALVAIDLASDAATVLLEEPRDDAFGAPLGHGDFRRDALGGGELWWPSARGVIHRFSMTGEDATAAFTALDGAPLPDCSRLSPREVRAIPPLAAP